MSGSNLENLVWRVEADGGACDTAVVVDDEGGPFLIAKVAAHWDDAAKYARLIAAGPRMLVALRACAFMALDAEDPASRQKQDNARQLLRELEQT